MTERLLQFIWQFQYFQKNDLQTLQGEPVHVVATGYHNNNQGPDFTDAKMQIGNTLWAGNIELHLKTSDWKKHGHDADKNYNNVILHVVFENDIPVPNHIPLVELKHRISSILLHRYESLMSSTQFIPCGQSIQTVNTITWQSWKERLLAERLMRKAAAVNEVLQQTNGHWEETFWRLLARNFGMKINSDAFEQMARSISINILAKHKQQIHQLEALLMGQAGLLNDTVDEDYPHMLQKEYHFLQHKYNLQQALTTPVFLRMRPVNFPTIRLAQLAMLIHDSAHLFSKIKEATDVDAVKKWMDTTANDYWHYHYRFGQASPFRKKNLGKTMTENIIINTVVPVLFAYGHYHSNELYKEKALQWVEELAAESNHITNGFQQLGVENKNAFDSQSLIELKNEYCNKKRCLECAVGNAILKNV